MILGIDPKVDYAFKHLFGRDATRPILINVLDIWLYFLRHAEKMDTDALPAALQEQPLAMRAIEELKMLTQTDLDRERYESRRKAQLDYTTGLNVAREEGHEVGREEGEKRGVIRTIHFCEQLLRQTETATSQLLGLTLAELNRLADELQAEVLKQHQATSARSK